MVHRNANPSFTHQPSHGDCSPPLSLNQHCLLNSTPFPRFWSCFGREMLWSGLIPCRVFRQCLWGKRGSPCVGFIPGGGSTQKCAQRPCNAPCCPKSIPCHTGLSQINDCLLGNGDLLISGLFHQPGVISQQPQSCSFHNLKWNSHFSRASHFTPTFVLECCSHLNAHSNAVPELWAVPVEQEISNPVGHTFPGDLAHRFGLVFNSPTF